MNIISIVLSKKKIISNIMIEKWLTFLLFQTDKTNETDRKKSQHYRLENRPLAMCIDSDYGKTDLYWFDNKFGKKPHWPNCAHPCIDRNFWVTLKTGIMESKLVDAKVEL